MSFNFGGSGDDEDNSPFSGNGFLNHGIPDELKQVPMADANAKAAAYKEAEADKAEKAKAAAYKEAEADKAEKAKAAKPR